MKEIDEIATTQRLVEAETPSLLLKKTSMSAFLNISYCF